MKNNLSDKRILLTGAAGFVGRHYIVPLLHKGYEVHAVSTRPHDASPGVVWHQTDLLDAADTSTLLQRVKPSHLLHLAWYTEHGKFWNADENLHWVQASLDLLEAFARNGGQRILMTGSCVEYDWRCGDSVFNEETTPINSAFLYGTCKSALYGMADSYCRLYDLSLAWGRLFFMYGPDEPESRLVSSVIRALLRGEPVPCSHGEQIRDFLYVLDVADALVAVLDSELRGAVNIAQGEGIAVKQMVGMIGRMLDRPELVQLGAIPAQLGEPPEIVADATRLKSIDWQPTYSLEPALEQTIGWWTTRLELSGNMPV